VYIRESELWPTFVFSTELIEPELKKVLALQEQLIGKAKSLPENTDREAEMDALIQDALQTSRIEGEKLNFASVRSSVAKQLGFAKGEVTIFLG
jgi:Fic family protein